MSSVGSQILCFPSKYAPRRDPGPSYGGVWGLKSLGFEGPRAVWSAWAAQDSTFFGGCQSFVRPHRSSTNATVGKASFLPRKGHGAAAPSIGLKGCEGNYLQTVQNGLRHPSICHPVPRNQVPRSRTFVGIINPKTGGFSPRSWRKEGPKPMLRMFRRFGRDPQPYTPGR